MSVIKLIEKIVLVLNYFIGKGYGSSSIKTEIKLVKKLITKPKLVIDVGANVGSYTDEIIRSFGEEVEIHVFEPSKTNIYILNKKFGTNERVFINPVGLGDITSTSTLYSDQPGSGLGSLTKRKLDHFGIQFDHSEEVKIIRFDEYWEKNLKNIDIDFMKIDVEGHEMNVLRGVGDVIKRVKCFQFEFGGCNIDTRTFYRDFFYFFNNNGFIVYRISPLGLIRLKDYNESDEYFSTTNFIVIREW